MQRTLQLTLPGELEQAMVLAAADEGKPMDVLVVEAIRRDMARRELTRLARAAELRRGNLSDEEVETIVEKAIQEVRQGV